MDFVFLFSVFRHLGSCIHGHYSAWEIPELTAEFGEINVIWILQE